jgi:hypothetical protein
MYQGSVHLHNLLRWIILILLVANVIRHLMAMQKLYGQRDISLGKWLMISSHTMLVLGLYQWFVGGFGLNAIKNLGMGELMKNSINRYWAVEHLVGMLIAIVLVTIAYGVRKKTLNDAAKHKRALVLYVLALAVILAMMPWPGREGIGRALFPGM